MSIIFSHPTGNANSREAVIGLAEQHLLTSFYTSIASFKGDLLDKIGQLNFLSEIRRRRFDSILKPFTNSFPWLEAARLSSSRLKLHELVAHETGRFCIDKVYNQLDEKIAGSLQKPKHNNVHAVYAYEDAALSSFEAAKQRGIKCLYDLPTGYWRAAHSLLQKENEQWPAWASTMSGFIDSTAKLQRKDSELRLADCIFVASKFTADTLQTFPGELVPVKVIPYGFPLAGSKKHYSGLNSGRKIKMLFVGKLTQQKGLANLLEAIEPFSNRIELTIVGHKGSNDCLPLNNALLQHKWIPSLSHGQILEIMKANDVLLFPTLFDGFGLVMTEAMSQGTPVIATERCAGPDLIMDGESGWLVKAGSSASLRTAIENILQQPLSIKKAGEAAMETARKRPWSVYRTELVNEIKSVLN